MKKTTFLIAALALTLGSCSNEEGPAMPSEEKVAAEVTAEIGGMSTRATGTTWDNADVIGISTTSNGKTSYTNVPYTFDGTMFAATDPIYFQDINAVTFSAYYPYSASAFADAANPSIAINTDAASQSAANQPGIDFLYASGATASVAAPNVSFTGASSFNHRMSQISVQFIEGDGVKFNGKLTGYTVKGLTLSGKFNPATGVASVGAASPADLSISLDGATVSPDALILIPQQFEKLSMELTLDGVTYKTDLVVDGNELLAGKNYLFKVTVNKTGLTVSDATINSWVTVEGSGTATM